MKNKFVLVIGRASTGSKLIAKLMAHILGVTEYGTWEGHDCPIENNSENIVIHKSLPNDRDWPDVNGIISEYPDHEIYIIITTREETLAKQSRTDTYHWTEEQEENDKFLSKNIISSVMNSGNKFFIWSYETFMFLGIDYLISLCKFMGIEEPEIPDYDFIDANPKRIRDSIVSAFRKWMNNYLMIE